MRSARGKAPWLAALLFLAALAGACTTAAAKGKTLPSRAEVERLPASAYVPERPLEAKTPGVAARSTFSVSSSRGYRVGLIDLVVAPAEGGRPIPLESAAVIEVRAGEGTVSLGQQKSELKPGSVFVVPQGDAPTIQAKGGPLELRAYVFSSE